MALGYSTVFGPNSMQDARQHIHTVIIMIMFLSRQIRRAAGKMKEAMYWRMYRLDDADARPSEYEARNVLRISRMAAVLDPRMKNVDWASEEDAER